MFAEQASPLRESEEIPRSPCYHCVCTFNPHTYTLHVSSLLSITFMHISIHPSTHRICVHFMYLLFPQLLLYCTYTHPPIYSHIEYVYTSCIFLPSVHIACTFLSLHTICMQFMYIHIIKTKYMPLRFSLHFGKT